MKKPNIFDLIIGVLMVAVGVFVWINPVETLVAMSLYLGISFIVAGVIYTVKFFNYDYTPYLTYGILDVLVGGVLISNTAIVASSMPILLGFWILFNSIIQISNAIEYKKIGFDFWGYVLSFGIIGAVFALVVLANPTIGAVTIALIVGVYMVLFGVAEISEYVYLKKNGIGKKSNKK